MVDKPKDDLPEGTEELEKLLDEKLRTECTDMTKKGELAVRSIVYLWKIRDVLFPTSFDDILKAVNEQMKKQCDYCGGCTCLEEACPVFRYRRDIEAALMRLKWAKNVTE